MFRLSSRLTKNMPSIPYLAILLLTFQNACVDSQNAGGREFVIMYMQNFVAEGSPVFPLELFLTTLESDVTVNVTTPIYTGVGALNSKHTVSNGNILKLEFDDDLRQTGTSKGVKTILVSASSDIIAYGVNKLQYSTDAFLALPLTTLGIEYYAICYSPPTTNCEFGISATVDGTTVLITLPNAVPGQPAANVTYNGVTTYSGQYFSVSLNKYETFQAQSLGDLTGAHILSNEPIAVFSGNVRTSIRPPDDMQPSRDHLVEQVPPVLSWGREFVTVPIPGRSVGDVFRILASRNNTLITVDALGGGQVISLNAGKYYEFDLNVYNHITSNAPILVVQFVKSQQTRAATEPADPSMIIIPPTEQFQSDYNFLTPVSTQANTQNYVLLSIQASQVAGLRLDGQPLAGVTWNPIPGTSYVGTSFNVTTAAHTLTHVNGVTFMGLLYGTADRESYGLPMGMRLTDISTTTTSTTTVATTTTCVCPTVVCTTPTTTTTTPTTTTTLTTTTTTPTPTTTPTTTTTTPTTTTMPTTTTTTPMPTAPPIADTTGKEFLIMYMDNVVENPSGFPLELYVTTSKPNVSVNVIAPGYPLVVSLTDSLTAGTVKQFNIPKELRQVGTGLERKAILVEATDDVVVYGVNKELFSNDAFLAYPTDTLGTEHFTVSYAPPTTNCEFGIVGVVDGTTLEITFPIPSGTPVQVSYGGVNYGNGDKLTVPSFNRSHTLQIRSQGDLTGTFIKATNPVAVFSGNVRTAVGESESRDHLVEQIPPIRSWGTEFVTVPIPRRTVGDLFRIIASVNNTVVTISGMPDMTIDRGEFVQVNISSTMYASIRATRPILVMQIVYSQFDPDEPADPAMITVPPTDQFAQEYSFLTPVYSGGVTGGDYTHLFLLAIREEDRNGLWLDGQQLNSTHTVNWNRITGTDFVGTWVNVSGGAHTVYHPNATFMGLLYGTADRETYGFPVGMRLADIAVNYTTPAVTVTTVTTEAPSTVTACTAALVEISDFNMALAFAIAVGVNLLTACLLIIATYKWRQAVGENKFEETMEIPYRPDSNGTIGGVGGVTTQPDPDHIDRNWLMNADDFEGHEKGSYDINSRL